MRDLHKLDIESIVSKMRGNDIYFYDLLTYFVSNAEPFVDFMVSNKFIPTRTAGEAYFKANAIANTGAYAEADLSYLMYAEVEKVNEHYTEQRRKLLVLFINIIMANIGKFTSTINSVKYSEYVPSLEYFKQLSEIIVKAEALPVLGIMDIIIAKDNGDNVGSSKYAYNYDTVLAAKPYLDIIHSKLISLCHDTSITADVSGRVVSRVLSLLVGTCTVRESSANSTARISAMFNVNTVKKDISATEILMSTDIMDLWANHIYTETPVNNPVEYNAVMFITNMYLLATTKEYERFNNCGANEDEVAAIRSK